MMGTRPAAIPVTRRTMSARSCVVRQETSLATAGTRKPFTPPAMASSTRFSSEE